jgi:hypothetical protein
LLLEAEGNISEFNRLLASLSPPVGEADIPLPEGDFISLPLRGRWQSVSSDGRRKRQAPSLGER